MPKINNGGVYPLKETLVGNDRFIGSDSEDNENTKNFNMSGVLSYVSDNLNLGGSNVQSDWTEVNSSSDSFIKNKPTIPIQNNKIKVVDRIFPPFFTGEITDQVLVDNINNGLPLNVDQDELVLFNFYRGASEGVPEFGKKLWLSTGEGTYGAGNTQITISDLVDDNEYVLDSIDTIVGQGIVFKNLSDNTNQDIKGKITMENIGGIPSIQLKKSGGTGDSSVGLEVKNYTDNGGAVGVEVRDSGAGIILAADPTTGTGNLLEVRNSRLGSVKVLTGSIDKEGNFTGNTFVKSGSTSDDILLGDGTTTSLSNISSGATETTFNVNFVDTGGGATYSTGFNSGRALKIGSTVIVDLAVQGINTTGTPTGFFRMEGLPYTVSSFATASVVEFHGQTQPFITVLANVNPDPSNNVLFEIKSSSSTTFGGDSNFQNAIFTNGRIRMTIVYRTND